jgi:lambda family phage portal protein
MKNYQPPLLSPTQELDENTRYEATARSRELSKNGSLGRACLDRPVEMAIQRGLRLKSRPNAEILGITADQSEDFGRKVEAHFNLYANSCDIDMLRTSTFNDLQSIAMATAFASGDCFAFTPEKDFAGCAYRIKLLLVEGELVGNPSVSVNSQFLRDGIEIDSDGTPTAYHVRQGYPSDFITGSPLTYKKTPIFGEGTGLRRSFHLYTRRRPGQYRGEVLLQPVLEKIHQATQLDRAELTASLINAIFTVFRTMDAPPDDPNTLLDLQAQDADNIPELPELGPGICADLFGSEKIDFADPQRPNVNYMAFMDGLVKQIGAAIGVPAEEILLKYDSSYSAARAAMLRAWVWYQNRRRWLSDRILTPFYRVWFTEAATLGVFDVPEFFDNQIMRQAWMCCEWLPPAKGHVDEEKEARAAQTRINSGVSCVEYEAAALGYDFWGELYPKLKREREALLAIGIDVYDDNVIQKVLQSLVPKAAEKEE